MLDSYTGLIGNGVRKMKGHKFLGTFIIKYSGIKTVFQNLQQFQIISSCTRSFLKNPLYMKMTNFRMQGKITIISLCH